jgi:putative SOS response-associated peptidase YedK
MCGRFVRKRSSSAMAKDFGVQEITDDLQPSFNVAPTQLVAVVLNSGKKQMAAMRWGLVPSWATDPTIAGRLINARAETLMAKAAFKEAFKRRRCLVVADGFFEWQKQGSAKIPLFIHLKPERPFGFAGLYEIWTPPLGEPLVTCTIITTEPNQLVKPIHDRMPVIVPKDAEDFWLDPDVEDRTRLLDLLQPYPSDEMAAYVVSKLVNSVKNDSPECIEPVAAMGQPLLF